MPPSYKPSVNSTGFGKVESDMANVKDRIKAMAVDEGPIAVVGRIGVLHFVFFFSSISHG